MSNSAFTGHRGRAGKRKVSRAPETKDRRSGFPVEGDGHSSVKDAGLYGTNSSHKMPRVRLFRSTKSDTNKASTVRKEKIRTSNVGASTPSTARQAPLGQSIAHVVCAISENLAKETCVASLDATSPVSLHVVKQANGQTYGETLAFLDILQPDPPLIETVEELTVPQI